MPEAREPKDPGPWAWSHVSSGPWAHGPGPIGLGRLQMGRSPWPRAPTAAQAHGPRAHVFSHKGLSFTLRAYISHSMYRIMGSGYLVDTGCVY